MTIELFYWPFSPPARAVLMLTKELKLDIKEQLTDLAAGQHYEPDFLNLNPCHTVPTMNDNGFILWESRAIMQYLCDKYAPDSQLYPKDLKQRALVDRWLYTDATGFLFIRDITFFSQLLPVVTNWTKFAFNNHLQVLNKMIGDNQYLVGDHLTIADLSVLASLTFLFYFDYDLTDYPNIKRWYSSLAKELPYFDDINTFSSEELDDIVSKMKVLFQKNIG